MEKKLKRNILLFISFIFPIILAACYGMPSDYAYTEYKQIDNTTDLNKDLTPDNTISRS